MTAAQVPLLTRRTDGITGQDSAAPITPRALTCARPAADPDVVWQDGVKSYASFPGRRQWDFASDELQAALAEPRTCVSAIAKLHR